MSIFTWGVSSLVSAKPEEPKPERFNSRLPGVTLSTAASRMRCGFF